MPSDDTRINRFNRFQEYLICCPIKKSQVVYTVYTWLEAFVESLHYRPEQVLAL